MDPTMGQQRSPVWVDVVGLQPLGLKLLGTSYAALYTRK